MTPRYREIAPDPALAAYGHCTWLFVADEQGIEQAIPPGRCELSALVGVGERQLQRRFAEVVGISPRALGVIIRLRRVFDALRDAPWSSWSERAQAAGFFDHPQMARDFRRLLGQAPSQWAKGSPGLAASLADPGA
jgi:transcriptional regulator GlxA family with amidase domain